MSSHRRLKNKISAAGTLHSWCVKKWTLVLQIIQEAHNSLTWSIYFFQQLFRALNQCIPRVGMTHLDTWCLLFDCTKGISRYTCAYLISTSIIFLLETRYFHAVAQELDATCTAYIIVLNLFSLIIVMRRHKCNHRVFGRPGWGEVSMIKNPWNFLRCVPLSSDWPWRVRVVSGEEGDTGGERGLHLKKFLLKSWYLSIRSKKLAVIMLAWSPLCWKIYLISCYP